jgi:hypothetical protein
MRLGQALESRVDSEPGVLVGLGAGVASRPVIGENLYTLIQRAIDRLEHDPRDSGDDVAATIIRKIVQQASG